MPFFRRNLSKVFVVSLAFLCWEMSACNYSTSYFRLGPDGKKIKASGPITPDELAGTVPEAVPDGTPEAPPPPPPPPGGEDEEIAPEGTGGGTTGGTTDEGNPETAQSVALMSADLRAIRPIVHPFVHVSINRLTKAVEIFLGSTEKDSSPKKLTDFEVVYESPLNPTIAVDAQRVFFTHPSESPALYQITGLDQETPSVSKWENNAGFSVSLSPDEDKAVFVAGDGASLRTAKGDGTGNAEEAEKDVGSYWGVSVSPVRERSDPVHGKIVFSFDLDGSGPKKPDLFLKNPGVVYPGMFLPLTATPSTGEAWPSFSPDGKRISFVRDGFLAFCDLNFDEHGKPSCDNAFAVPGLLADSPCWTADGARVLFSTPRDGDSEIYSVNPYNASDLQNVTNNHAADDVQPACFPNPVLTMKKEIMLPANPSRTSPPVDSSTFRSIKP